jgi:hypothetical protein
VIARARINVRERAAGDEHIIFLGLGFNPVRKR